MGLGGMKYAWQRQTKDFAHTKGDQYSSLVIDNRGIGDSDKPRYPRYSTSEMAKDIVELVDHVGWTGQRELHVIGISMGGMIAQEIVSPSTSTPWRGSSARQTSLIQVRLPDAVPSVVEHKYIVTHTSLDVWHQASPCNLQGRTQLPLRSTPPPHTVHFMHTFSPTNWHYNTLFDSPADRM